MSRKRKYKSVTRHGRREVVKGQGKKEKQKTRAEMTGEEKW